jgi:CRP-like cAMP-binding protein
LQTELVDHLARLGIFRDLTPPELAEVASNWEVASFREGQRIISAGQENTSFYIIVEGEAAVFVGDEQRGLLVRGSFFGDVSALLGESATADILTRSPLRCLVVPAAELEHFLVNNPRVMFRVLQTVARRLQRADAGAVRA